MPGPVTGDWSAEQLANSRRAYYACITHIDYTLGLLFARMRELDLLENTWIIFTSDHGENLGDHHMGAKSSFMEGSAHIPMVVRPPAAAWDPKPLAGRRVDTLVTLADVMPTILRLAELTDDAVEHVESADEDYLFSDTTCISAGRPSRSISWGTISRFPERHVATCSPRAEP